MPRYSYIFASCLLFAGAVASGASAEERPDEGSSGAPAAAGLSYAGPITCSDSGDCGGFEYCTVEVGVCDPAPGCNPSPGDSETCSPKGSFCVQVDGEADPCCGGGCKTYACTNGFPASCFGVCEGRSRSTCSAACYGTCQPRELPTFSELVLCTQEADCKADELCTVATQACDPVGFPLLLGEQFCVGVCLPRSAE